MENTVYAWRGRDTKIQHGSAISVPIAIDAQTTCINACGEGSRGQRVAIMPKNVNNTKAEIATQ
jgi:hypothetical protein